MAVIALVFLGLVARAAYIQIVEPENLIRQGDMRSLRVHALPSSRGIISDRNGEPLAVSVPVEAVWADPKVILQKGALEKTAHWYALADVLGLDRNELLTEIRQNPTRRFIYLQRQVSPAMANYIRELKIPGVGLKDESRRYYPTSEVSAHLVGVTGIDGNGLEGIERRYNSHLTGEAGKKTIRKAANGTVVENIALEEKKPGQPLELTIDQRLQAIAYRAIKQVVADHRATSGSAVMIDVETGAVLAMVNAPSYNPNNRADLLSFKMRNRVLTDIMEPGSTVKPFVVVAALENGVVTPDTVIDTGNGTMRVGGNLVRDTSKVGKADLTTILKKSSNIGVTKMALQMPVDALLGTYSAVGLGSLSGLNLEGEVVGIFPDRQRWSDHEHATLSFGYGLAITPIQLAHAYATLANHGRFEPIHIIKENGLEGSKQVLNAEYADLVLKMMETVTQEGGTATSAAIPGYRVAAKTGTTRKASAGGYSDEYIAITAGVAPVSNPRLALVVVVNEPSGDNYGGGSVAGPVFAEILQSALQILNIAPDENTLKR
ncbi:penicillin-binding transpeptidase domain-containing protein [Vibrio agarilyticus]|nr:penicillin-binding transpeptidase domain-containing protein [Vibrio agarilyticus]